MQSEILFFESYSDQYPYIENTTLTSVAVTDIDAVSYLILSDFDFDMSMDWIERFYIDTYVIYPPGATLKVRIPYSFEHDSSVYPDWIFIEESIHLLIEDALVKTLRSFKRLFKENNMVLPPEMVEYIPKPSYAFIKKLSKRMLNDYYVNRKAFIESNYEQLQTTAIRLLMNEDNKTLILLPWLVMNELLFDNAAFNRQLNREFFFRVIPEPLFFSLRAKCTKPKSEFLVFSVMELRYMLTCMDCTIQILNSDKGSFLQESLQQNNYSSELQTEWMRVAETLIGNYSPVTPANPDSDSEPINWYTTIKLNLNNDS